ncbi:Bacterial type II secretion system protein F domain protein [Gimesia alba]|uniref:Bacterial type II secretion system protein F domain protein n=1 Tax=Gimesia alba TaxID=2527973 RepID=A0A517RKP9_9PLAN|nr:type II secretion system F family protein [Gimesia alba]QDT44402.1 Bacterial type II secretion system protein F domain protein [Gimesia alba]
MDQTLIISIAAFFGMMALVGAIVFVFKDFSSSKAEDRLAVITGKKKADEESASLLKEEFVKGGLNSLSDQVAHFFEKFGNLKLLLEQAEAPFKADTFLLMTGVAAAAGFALAWFTNAPVPFCPVAAIATGSLPFMWLLFCRNRRFKKFALQLPDALELVGRALRSGHSLASGLSVVVQEMPAPIATEFALAYEEQNLGVPIDEALKSMLKRMPNLDLKFFVTAVVIQRQAGGDLAEILDKIGHIIRQRFKIMGQVQALTGEGRISGVVLMALPIALFFAVYYLNPDYVMLLFTDELGRKMIAGGIVLQVLGALWIKKIINIKI